MSIDVNILLSLAVGIIIGFACYRFINRGRSAAFDEKVNGCRELQVRYDTCTEQLESLKHEIHDHLINKATLEERVKQLNQVRVELDSALSGRDEAIRHLNQELSDQHTTIAELETAMKKDREAAAEKLALLEEAKDKLGNEFKVLANQIFEEKGKAFSEQNCASLDEVLKPMREQLGDFRKRVDEVHLNDAKDRASLREHLAQLEGLNRQMSEDALNLTQALKGESKAQGNWGEMILERILESSGLREGHEFLREDSTDIGGGKRHRPDVIVRMPGEKHIIIDSKVSLTDYERALSASESSDRKQAVKAHVNSLKKHIRSLSDKRYDQLPDIHSPDYVLMFVPIEGAYMMAIEADQGIFEAAFDKRVAVVTPSTLYATLKLVEQLWRYERQSENVVKLIERASLLHDKMVGFVEAFEDIGKRLGQARDSYDTALGRMKTGPGNVIGQIATLGNLAGKTRKELPAHLVEAAGLEDQTNTPE
ncbi:MAG: DNA recombination protein RmuC [Mariprofundus sp.]